jgi:hypothetical protein
MITTSLGVIDTGNASFVVVDDSGIAYIIGVLTTVMYHQNL